MVFLTMLSKGGKGMNIEEGTKMKLEQVWHQSFTSKEILDMENGYKSIAEIICKDLEARFEDDVFKVVQKYDINVDKEELIKALNYDRNQYKAGYKDALEWMQRVIMLNMPDIIRYSENQDAGVQIKNINDYIDLRLKQLLESEGIRNE